MPRSCLAGLASQSHWVNLHSSLTSCWYKLVAKYTIPGGWLAGNKLIIRLTQSSWAWAGTELRNNKNCPHTVYQLWQGKTVSLYLFRFKLDWNQKLDFIRLLERIYWNRNSKNSFRILVIRNWNSGFQLDSLVLVVPIPLQCPPVPVVASYKADILK